MDPGKQELFRQVIGMVRDELVGAVTPQGGPTQQQRRQQALLKMLVTGDVPVQWVAIKELGQIGNADAAEALKPFTAHPNAELSNTARAAVNQIMERRAAVPPPPISARGTSSPLRPVPPPPPPSRTAGVVEAHMGRDRGTRLTKGQDLPVPLTETQLGEQEGPVPTALAGMGLALGGLPSLATMAEGLPAVPAMAAPNTDVPDPPAPAEAADNAVDYSALGIPRATGAD